MMKITNIRILQYIGDLGSYGGSEAVIMEIYRKIDRSKIQFDFVVDPGSSGGYVEEAKKLGARLYECPGYRGTNHFSFCRWWDTFLTEHREYRILHGHIRSSASIYGPIAQKHGLITIIHSHNTSNGIGLGALVKDILQLPIRYQADYLFACSNDAGKWLFGTKAKYHVMPNAIDIKKFQFDPSVRRIIRGELGLTNQLLIGHVGSFKEQKNHIFLIRIFAEICKKTDARLILIGDGSLKKKIQSTAEKEKIDNRIIFIGERKDVERYYNAMDVFLFPSKWEGFGVSAVEAQANALPVVVSDVLPKEIDITDKVVRLKTNSAPSHWAKVIMRITKDKTTRGILSKENQGKLKKYDSTLVAKEMKEFYCNLI